MDAGVLAEEISDGDVMAVAVVCLVNLCVQAYWLKIVSNINPCGYDTTANGSVAVHCAIDNE